MLLLSLLIFCCKNTKLLQNVQYISGADDKIKYSVAIISCLHSLHAEWTLRFDFLICHRVFSFHRDFRWRSRTRLFWNQKYLCVNTSKIVCKYKVLSFSIISIWIIKCAIIFAINGHKKPGFCLKNSLFVIQKRPIFTSKPIGLSSESAPFSRLCKHPLPFYALASVLLFYFERKSKHFRNIIL